MAFNGSGTYTLPTPALNIGDTVSSTENNTFRNDVAAAFNKTATRDGQTVPTANLPMGGFKHTGLAAGTSNGDSVRFEQIPTASSLGLVIGTNVQAWSTTLDSWSGKAVPTGTVVGTTDTQTLTNKTLTNQVATIIRETATVSATAATGTINFDAATQVVLYYTTNASGNFTVNFRANSGATLDSIMSTGQSLSATFLVTNGSTAYYNSAVTIDGNSVTPKWQGGTAPTSGNASAIDGYTYVIIKVGSASFTVLASVTKFA